MTKRSRYFTSNLLSQGGCNALYIDKQQKNHSCKIGNLQVSNKIIRKKGFSAKNKIYPKKVLTSTNKEATIQAKLAIFRLSCNPLLFVIIFDHTSVVKQDSAIFRPQPSLLSLWTEQRLSNMEFSALYVKKYKRYFSTKCFKRWVKTI